jgi:hypothetical protein
VAVVSQPFDRNSKVRLGAKLDPNLGEFWVESPWDIVKEGHNLSAYERKRIFLNVRRSDGSRDFLDISFLTGADGTGDGRSVVAGDFRNIGRMDLVLRQSGGGPVMIYENDFPQRHYLKVTVRGRPESVTGPDGRKSNRLGIGARLIAEAQGQPRVREMYPLNSYRSQMPNIVHFGLGDATKVDKLTIRWPSGKVQVLTDVPADQHIVVDEGKEGNEAIERVVPGRTIQPK